MIKNELKKLASHSIIYGAADVIPYLVNFLLLPVFTAYLSPADYGALGILVLFAVLTKIFFRMGLDSGFFRLYFDQKTAHDRKLLATTLFLTAFAVSLLLFALVAFTARPLTVWILGSGTASASWVLLVALDTLLNTFAFVPMNLFRVEGNPKAFTFMTLIRSFVNIALKVALVVGGYGVSGVLLADVAASFLFVVALSPTLARNLVRGFSRPMLSESLAFGLPKVPHGLAHQVLNLSDRKLVEIFLDLAATGLYHIGYMMGTGVKFFLAAFELAWSPWVYAQLEKPDAPRVLARIVTYAFALLLGFGLLNAVFGRELLVAMAAAEFHDAHPVIPIVVLAYMMQGSFALTSIGIGISKQTRFFPVITFAAAVLNVILNIVWIPTWGIVGAAWATVAGYTLMAVLGFAIGNRYYPIPFELSRLVRIVAAAAVTYALSRLAPSDWLRAMVTKALIVVAYPVALYVFGFFRKEELDWLRRQLRRPRG